MNYSLKCTFFRDGTPPPIDLPDLQLDPKLWGTYIIGRISDWIDCDSKETWLADLSCIEIEKVRNKRQVLWGVVRSADSDSIIKSVSGRFQSAAV